MPRTWRNQLADEVRATSMMKPKWTDEEMEQTREEILADALRRMLRMHALFMRDADHGNSFYQNETLREMNSAPLDARKALDRTRHDLPDLSDIS